MTHTEMYWRAVADELPPLDETFIAWFDTGEIMLLNFFDDEDLSEYMGQVKSFTHWMPLPAPPKKT